MNYLIVGLLVIGTSFGFAQESGGEAAGAAVSGPAVLEVSQTDDLGEFLVDAEGMTLYMFTEDTENTSNCYDDCATAWPPLLTDSEPTLGDGLDAALVRTTEHTDGTAQVTYGGWPLYHWVNDAAPPTRRGRTSARCGSWSRPLERLFSRVLRRGVTARGQR